jgi:hypothetical protein
MKRENDDAPTAATSSKDQYSVKAAIIKKGPSKNQKPQKAAPAKLAKRSGPSKPAKTPTPLLEPISAPSTEPSGPASFDSLVLELINIVSGDIAST